MDKSHQQAQETRRHNAEARVAEIRAKTAALSAARHALSRVLEDPNATPEQVLEAARLLLELGKS